jgi:hypothetical protein
MPNVVTTCLFPLIARWGEERLIPNVLSPLLLLLLCELWTCQGPSGSASSTMTLGRNLVYSTVGFPKRNMLIVVRASRLHFWAGETPAPQ